MMAGAQRNQPRQNQVVGGLPNDGYYKWKMHDELRSPDYKYTVTEMLGKGTFGTVLSCSRECLRNGGSDDLDKNVAVKVLRTNGRRVGEAEFTVLWNLRAIHGPFHNCLRLIEAFTHKEHFCIVMEKLDINLFQFLKYLGPDQLISLDNLRIIVKDILTALQFMQAKKMVHTDLKTTNVALIDHERLPFRVKVVDFGSTLHTQDLFEYRSRFNLQTINYRSPELFLKYYPYSEAIDMWSLGVIMLELFYHERLPHRVLYNGICEYDQVRHIVEGQGMPPKEMLDEGKATTIYFRKTRNRQGWRLLTPREYIQTPHFKMLQATRGYRPEHLTVPKPVLLDGFGSVALFDKPHPNLNLRNRENLKRNNYGDLLNKMLEVNPVERITPSEALRHPFLALLNIGRVIHGQPRRRYRRH